MTAIHSLQHLRYEKRNRIAWLTLSRPRVLNALNVALMQELDQAFDDVRNDADVLAAVLTGEGDKAFAAGADISELAPLGVDAARELARHGQAVFSRIESCGKPLIAAVNGFALGAGCELALACSLRLASPNARFGQPEVKLGLIPGYGGTQRLPRLVGKGRALELLLTGETIDAAEALRIGLVNQVVAANDLLSAAEALAARIIANGPMAVRYCLDAVNQGTEMTLEAGLAHEAALFGLCCASEDKNEGTRAFLEKRPPRFKGSRCPFSKSRVPMQAFCRHEWQGRVEPRAIKMNAAITMRTNSPASDALGRLTSLGRPNGTTTSYQYDPLSYLSWN